MYRLFAFDVNTHVVTTLLKETDFSLLSVLWYSSPFSCTVRVSHTDTHTKNTLHLHTKPFVIFNISLCHTQLSACFISSLGGRFPSTLSHAFIPFNLFSVTKQNLLIFCKAPNESLYAHSVPFSPLCWSLSHTLKYTHTHRVELFEQLCSALCMFISAIVMVLLLSFLPLHPALVSNATMGNYRRIHFANVNDLLSVAARQAVGGERPSISLLGCAKVALTSLKIQPRFVYKK